MEATNDRQTLQQRIFEIQSAGRKRLLERIEETQELAGLLSDCEAAQMTHLASRDVRAVGDWAQAARKLNQYLEAHSN